LQPVKSPFAIYARVSTAVQKRLSRIPTNEQQIIYRPPKPRRDGRTALSLTPLELIDDLAALIPPLKPHRRRSHSVLATR
jgi:hypothetical protein